MPEHPSGLALVGALCCATLFTSAGCDGPDRVVLGISSSPRFVDAARLALEQSATQGVGVELDTVLVPDGTNLAAPAIRIAERFAALDGLVAVVGHSNSASSLAASPIYNDRRVVQLAPHSSAIFYSQAGPYSFRLVPPDDRQGAFLAQHLATSLSDGSRVAVLYVNDAYGRGLRTAFLNALDTMRLHLALELPHTQEALTEDDITWAAEALRVARPDVIVCLARANVVNRYLPAIRRELGNIPIVGGDAVAGAEHVPNDDGRWNGVRFVDFLDLDAGSPELQTFRRRYRERFGREATAPDALTYDAVGLVLAGIRAGARSGPELRDYLRSLGRERPPFQGITGLVAFDSAGDIDRSYVLRTIGGGTR